MMNVGIMFYAARETGDDALYDSALQHCLTSRRYLVRGDGSAVHEGIFDLETGAFLRESTHQGWRHDSSWARGLSWAIYGFQRPLIAFTRDPRFLADRLPMRRLLHPAIRPRMASAPTIGWSRIPPVPYEASAAAITSSGLQDLAAISSAIPCARYAYRRLRHSHHRIVSASRISWPAAISDWEGLLKQAAYHERLGLGVDESTMFGDYFFLESAAKLLKLI